MRKGIFLVLSFLSIMILASGVWAVPVTIHITANNSYELYLSDNVNNIGATLIGADNNFSTVETYYLDIDTTNPWYLNVASEHAQECLLADINIGGELFLTDLAHWQVSRTGFGIDLVTPTSYGYNVAPPETWYPIFSEIDTDAEYLWTDNNTDTNAYFTFYPQGAPVSDAVPEPTTICLLGTGLVGMFYSRNKKKA